MSIAQNLERLRTEMADACARAGRDPASVRLMAVSKVHPVELIVEAYEAGQRMFGENRVQEVQAKHERLLALPELDLHLIGPLQNNKTARAAELFAAVDTLDNAKTAGRLNAAAASLGRRISVLIEVKLSYEDSKHGLAPEDLPGLLAGLADLAHLEVRGLMTVPPWSEDPEVARPYFAELRRLRDLYREEYEGLTELSMGMSNDFRVAIEEGSTVVRLGTALFGKRPVPSQAAEE